MLKLVKERKSEKVREREREGEREKVCASVGS